MTIEWFDRARGFRDWQQEQRELRDNLADLGMKYQQATEQIRIAELRVRQAGLDRITLCSELALAQTAIHDLQAALAVSEGQLVSAQTAADTFYRLWEEAS